MTNMKYYTDERSQQIVISLLKAHGIRKVIASPGTTNITLIASIQQDPYFEIYSSVDERSAAYLACGLAAESGEPVVLSCTGATASRNYMPGLTEAFYRKLPILAITANQGTTKIGHHIAQNIDRTVLPNDIVRLSVDIPITRNADDEWNCEIQINKALLELHRNGGGPVHIDLTTTYSRDYSVQQLPPTRFINRITVNSPFPEIPQGRIAVFIGSHKQWSEEDSQALDNFCATNNAVAFCDHTSGYKGKYRVQFALVRGQKKYFSELGKVDLLIHIGEVSGNYHGTISSKEVWRVSEDGELRDTFRKLRNVFEMTEKTFFNYYTNNIVSDDSYLIACKKEYNHVYQQMPEIPFSNIWMAKQLSAKLPENSVLHLGILNTLRSWNFFELPNSVLSYSNVGGFGIDGNISSLIGASIVNPTKLYFAVLGDLAFFYDMNVLGNRHTGKNIRIMLINNGRGTEFRNYGHPGSAFGEDADKFIAAAGHYGNKSSLLIKHYAEDLGFEYITASNKEEFNSVYLKFISTESTERPILFEVFTDSTDESKALEITLNYISEKTTVLKNVVRKALGNTRIKIIRNILNK